MKTYAFLFSIFIFLASPVKAQYYPPGGGGGGGSGTVNTGTTGQLGYYASSGTTISGTNTQLQINSHQGVITADTDAATVTMNLATSDKHSLLTTSGVGTNRILALSNASVGQIFEITVIQDSVGNRTVTWFGGIKWPGSNAPTLTTTANKADRFIFECYGTNTYYGAIQGQNF